MLPQLVSRDLPVPPSSKRDCFGDDFRRLVCWDSKLLLFAAMPNCMLDDKRMLGIYLDSGGERSAIINRRWFLGMVR